MLAKSLVGGSNLSLYNRKETRTHNLKLLIGQSPTQKYNSLGKNLVINQKRTGNQNAQCTNVKEIKRAVNKV